MKIALIHNQYRRQGGMESVLFDMRDGFLANDDSVDIYSFIADKKEPVPHHCKLHLFLVRCLPNRWLKALFIFWMNHFFPAKKFDLSFSLTRTAAADIHICGGVHHTFISAMQKKKLSGNDKRELANERNTFEHCHAIVAHSKRIKDEIMQASQVPEHKIHVIYPPVNTKNFHFFTNDEKQQARASYGFPEHKTIILIVAAGDPYRKGHDLLLNAMEQLPPSDFHFVAAGKKIDSPLPHLVNLGYISQMPTLYAAVDCVIAPSRYEPFGLIIPESLQCGTPVIASQYCGATELMSETDGIVLDELTTEAIINACQTRREKCFEIAPNFIERHHLTLKNHIQALKAVGETLSS